MPPQRHRDEDTMPRNQKPNLTNALSEAGQSRRRQQEEAPASAAATVPTSSQPPSRQGTRPITAHLPKEVRDQLKILAIEQDTTVHGLLAEAINDLFAKYGKSEIAPTSTRQEPER